MNYWIECISEAMDEAGVTKLTDEQIETIADFVRGAHENYGLATGVDIADSNFVHEDTIKLKELEVENEKYRIWMTETTPCVSCLATGVVRDGIGIPVGCDRCGGKGRVRK